MSNGEPASLASKNRTHELKCWPEFFSKLWSGEKTFELRKDDRGFRAGDFLQLREWRPGTGCYTGRVMLRRVSYLMSGPAFGLMEDYVCMALSPPASPDETSGDGLSIDETRFLAALAGVKPPAGSPGGHTAYGRTLIERVWDEYMRLRASEKAKGDEA